MIREMPPFGNDPDPDIRRALEWFLSFLKPEEWANRVAHINERIESALAPSLLRAEAQPHNLLSITDDQIGWYLYLVNAVVNDVLKYEPTQGSRVAPIFKSFGTHLHLLKEIGGIEERIERMLNSERSQPDSILFELLVALLWAKNGYEVAFISEQPPERRPDIRAIRSGEEWFIECKRLQKSSAYSEAERDRWLAMWSPLRDILLAEKMSAVFDIVFHVELSSLPQGLLADQLPGKARLARFPCTLIDNEKWTVSATSVDYQSAQDHLRKYLVRYPGDQFNELIAGRRDPNRGFAGFAEGRYERVGDGGSNVFLDEMVFAAGAFWSCDAPEAIRRKARDIRGQLSRAVGQLPNSGRSAVHVAVETLDGANVEAERLLRILNSVSTFDARGKDLRWVYCHMLQSYAPPDQAWAIDETVHYFGRADAGNAPLAANKEFVILPGEAPIRDGVHWLRDPP